VIYAASAWLVLPDGRVVLQRRDGKARISANLLSSFGGGVEDGEKPEETIRRELSEETSLDVSKLNLRPLFDVEWVHPETKEVVSDSIFKASIPSLNFQVFEGVGAEAYSLDELYKRDDISVVVEAVLLTLGSKKE
jgi:8-oxo-dGTP pyrophosphatase MutT (NUDIX family)